MRYSCPAIVLGAAILLSNVISGQDRSVYGAAAATTASASGNLSIVTTALAMGQLNSPYSQTLIAMGGTPPYLWSVAAGRLPNGLTLNSSTGEISGVPVGVPPADGGGQISSINTVTFRVTDFASQTAVAGFTLAIGANGSATRGPLEFITQSFPSGQTNVPYSQYLIANGGQPPYTFRILDGTLPSGLSLNPATGLISGTPVAPTNGRLGFAVVDSTTPTAQQASTSFRISIVGSSAPQITTTSLPGGTLNSPYAAALNATGGTPPYTWSATGLPQGLSINLFNGAIGGTPTAPGTSSTSITVTDSASLAASASLPITIAAAGPSITTASSLPNGQVNQFYSQALTAAGGAAPYTWSLIAGTLPSGLTLNPSTGAISGTPTVAITNSQLMFRVMDSKSMSALATLTLTISPVISGGGPLTIVTSDPLPDAFVGVPYQIFLQASGGVPPYTWSSVSGRLSPGLFLSSTGEISGIPPGPFVFDGNFSVIYKVTDQLGQTATKFLGVNVHLPALHFTSTTLANGQVGVAYSQQIMTQFGTAPLTFAVTSGALPSGLSLNGATGVISGTPATASSASFLVKVSDTSSPAQTIFDTFTIKIMSGPTTLPGLAITTSSLPGGTVGSAYGATVTAVGGSTPYKWSASGLPNGVSINPATGAISGTPTTAGASSAAMTVMDSLNQSATKVLPIVIGNSGVALAVSTTSLKTGQIGVAFSQTLTANGGTPPYTWSIVTGRLHPGLSLNSFTGEISGTPSGMAPADGDGKIASDYWLVFRVADSASQSATSGFSLLILGAGN